MYIMTWCMYTCLPDVEDVLMQSDMILCLRKWKICLCEVILNFVEAMIVASEIYLRYATWSNKN